MPRGSTFHQRVTNDGIGGTTATAYDFAGRLASTHDGKGTTTYSYNGTDANGKKERRNLVNTATVSLASGSISFTGAHDAIGNLIRENLPGGIVKTTEFDVVGAKSALSYVKGDEDLIGFAVDRDVHSKIRRQESSASSQVYEYDQRDRLTRVEDTYSGLDSETSACTTRTYGFSLDSNRTTHTMWGPGTGGACQSSSGASTVTSVFDQADRITTSGYTYDQLGRTLSMPGAHTATGGGNVTIGYHANDMVATIQQSVPEDGSTKLRKQDFNLDVSQRIATLDTLVDGTKTESLKFGYANELSDSPAWIEKMTRPSPDAGWTTEIQRNIVGISSEPAVVETGGTTDVQLSNIVGDTVGTVRAGEPGLFAFGEYTEFGLPKNDKDYEYFGGGWMASEGRVTQGIVGDLSLMGLRLYVPSTGRFLSRDRITRGNDNPYMYPADPINMADPTGLASVYREYSPWVTVAKTSWKTSWLTSRCGCIKTRTRFTYKTQTRFEYRWGKIKGKYRIYKHSVHSRNVEKVEQQVKLKYYVRFTFKKAHWWEKGPWLPLWERTTKTWSRRL